MEMRDYDCVGEDPDCPADCDEPTDSDKSKMCDPQCCPHNGIIGEWAGWKSCEVTCDYYSYNRRECLDDPDYPLPEQCPPWCDEPQYDLGCYEDPCPVCVCRLYANAHLGEFDDETSILPENGVSAILSHKPNSECRFKVEAIYAHTNVVDYIKVTMDQGNLVVHLKLGLIVDFIAPALGPKHAVLGSFSQTVGNVVIQRSYNHNYIYVTDTVCGTQVAWDPYNAEARVVIIVPRTFSDYLVGQCGECAELFEKQVDSI